MVLWSRFVTAMWIVIAMNISYRHFVYRKICKYIICDGSYQFSHEVSVIHRFIFSNYSMCYCWYRLPNTNSSTIIIFIFFTYYTTCIQKLLSIFHQMEGAFAFRQFFIYITCVSLLFFSTLLAIRRYLILL